MSDKPSVRFAGTMPTRTLRGDAVFEGPGIHTGVPGRALVRPAEHGHGIAFCRDGGALVPADWRHADAEASQRRTVLIGDGGDRFEQVEHIMAALAVLGISDALIDVSGPEIPILGGGAKEFIDGLNEAGVQETGGEQPILEIVAPWSLESGDAKLMVSPHDGLLLSAFIEYPNTAIGSMGATVDMMVDDFLTEIAPARTFAIDKEVEYLRAKGMGLGGTLENTLIAEEKGFRNPRPEMPDEAARHKIIDLLGDLALTNCRLRGHFWAWRAGHRTHILLAQALASEFGATI